MPNSEDGEDGGCRYGTWQAPPGGRDTPWGLPESLPPPLPSEELLAPEGVCSPGLECDHLGEGAELLACWGERVCLSSSPWAPTAEARPGILCFDSRECGGPSGPLGLQVGSGAGLPQLIPG